MNTTNTKLQKFTDTLSNLFLLCLGLLAFQSIFWQSIFWFDLSSYKIWAIILNFIEKIQYALVILAIVFGSLIFYVKRDKIESIEEEREKEILEEEKRKKEFEKRFPRLNRIPVVWGIFRWFYVDRMYAVGIVLIIILWFSIYIKGIWNYWFQWDEYYQAKLTNNYIEWKWLFYLGDSDTIYYTRSRFTSLLPIISYEIFNHVNMNINKEFIYRLPIIILSVLTLILIYIITYINYWKKIAIISLFIISTEIWYVYMSKYLRFYIPTLLGIAIILALLSTYKKQITTWKYKVKLIVCIILLAFLWYKFIQAYFLFILLFSIIYIIYINSLYNPKHKKYYIMLVIWIILLVILFYFYKLLTSQHWPYDNVRWNFNITNNIYQLKWLIYNYGIYIIGLIIWITYIIYNFNKKTQVSDPIFLYIILSLIFLFWYINNVPFTFTHRPIFFFIAFIIIFSIYIFINILPKKKFNILMSLIIITNIIILFNYNITRPWDRYYPTKLIFEKHDIIFWNKDIAEYLKNNKLNNYDIIIIWAYSLNVYLDNLNVIKKFLWWNWTQIQLNKIIQNHIKTHKPLVIIVHATAYWNRHNKLYEKIYWRKNWYITEVNSSFSNFIEKKYISNIIYLSKDKYSKIFFIK